jgi:glycosyltransferase involved in cell wall biosynthesis
VRGGIATYTRAIAEALAGDGHEVHVVTRATRPPWDRTESAGGVHIHRLGPPQPLLPARVSGWEVPAVLARIVPPEIRFRQRAAAWLQRLHRRRRFDLIEVPESGAEGWFIQLRPRTPLVVRMHTPLAILERSHPVAPPLLVRLISLAERREILRADLITAPSRSIALEADAALKLGSPPIEIIPNPVPTALANRPMAPLAARDPDLVLFVGRIEWRKGPQVLAQAAPAILARRPSVRFVFAGSDSPAAVGNGTLSERILSELPEGVRPAVAFVGALSQERLAELYVRAAVVCLPSLYDNFPYSCLEAMACGAPIIGSTAGGMPEMLAHGEHGLLWSPSSGSQDGAGLADLVLTLLENPAFAARLGEQARARAHADFSPATVARRCAAAYERARQGVAAPGRGASRQRRLRT